MPPQAPQQPPQPQPQQPPPAPAHKAHPLRMLCVIVLVIAVAVLAALVITHKHKSVTTKQTAVQHVATTARVSISSQGFVPATIEVNPGTTITWTNNDSAAHWVATDPYPTDDNLPGFNSNQAFQKNDTYSFTFQGSGTYTYHDQLNPYTLKGSVIVRKAAQ